MKRRFERVEYKSAKFCEVTSAGGTVTLRFGTMGTDGQERVTDHEDDASAAAQAEALIAEKLEQGYHEVTCEDDLARSGERDLGA